MSSSGWLIGYVAVTVFSFPQLLPGWLGGELVDLGWLLAWFGPACLLIGLEGLAPARAARRAAVAGALAHAAIIHWIYVVTVDYGGAPPWAGVLAPLAMSLYPGAAMALFGACYAWLRKRGAASPLAVAALYAAIDHARSFVLGGWPWATLGYAQHENASLLGLASITGVYGLSFVTVLVSAALAETWLSWRRGQHLPRTAWLALAVASALLWAGSNQGAQRRPVSERSVRVAALQGNIAQGEKWDATRAETILQSYLGLARQAHAAGAQIVVWPESAAPGLIELEPASRASIGASAREGRAAHVVGAVGVELTSDQTEIAAFFDSAFVIDAEGSSLTRYDKTHLVPFGEYMPLRSFLGRFFSAIARGLSATDVSAGRAPRALDIPVVAHPDSPQTRSVVVRAGVPICYELLFPDLVRRFAADGGQLLLAITNDAWYGRTGAPYQFLAMTALRSAETGLWTVRAANSGVSAIIDAHGWVREETSIFERTVLVADVPLARAGTPTTFYVRHGDVFAWACWAVALVRMLGTGGRERRAARAAGAERGESRA